MRVITLLLLTVSVSADVRDVVKLRSANLATLAVAPDLAPSAPREHEHQQRKHFQFPPATTAAQTDAPAVVAAPPSVGTNFGAASSNTVYPADASGAVGPQHVVGAFNSGIYVFDRNGTRLVNLSLAQFWSDPSISSGAYYDPRIIYDAAANRWVVVALYDNGNLKKSTLVIGVSQTGDPSATWTRYRVLVDPNDRNVADFTRFGMTSDRFVVTANDDFGSDIWILTKAQLYTTITSVDHRAVQPYDLHPVTFVDNSSAIPLLVSNEFSSHVVLYRLDTSLTQVASLDAPGWSSPDPPEIAPQLGSARLMDVGETSLQTAVARNGSIWTVHMIIPPDPPRRSSIRWWKIATDGSRVESGTIDDPTGATFYAFPSIAVNRAQGALISYVIFGADRHPSAAYSYRDPSGVMSSTGMLKNGDNIPRQQRWGDYTTTVVDPANDTDFWSVQPYGTNADWAAWWGQVKVALPTRGRAVRH
jgi:hypothetical protein